MVFFQSTTKREMLYADPERQREAVKVYIRPQGARTSGESMNPLALAKPTMRTYSQPKRKAQTERAPRGRLGR